MGVGIRRYPQSYGACGNQCRHVSVCVYETPVPLTARYCPRSCLERGGRGGAGGPLAELRPPAHKS